MDSTAVDAIGKLAVNAIADEFRAVLTKMIGESADVRIGSFTP